MVRPKTIRATLVITDKTNGHACSDGPDAKWQEINTGLQLK